ncbi:hypothetical protein SprV_0301149300 [Sparganum proliferum]
MSSNRQTFLSGPDPTRSVPTRHVYLPSMVTSSEILRLRAPETNVAGGGLPGRGQGRRRRGRTPIGGRLKRLLSSKALLVSARAINHPSLDGCSPSAPSVLPLRHQHQFPLSPLTLQDDIRRTDTALPLSATLCSVNRVMGPSSAAVFIETHERTQNQTVFPNHSSVSVPSGLGRRDGNNGVVDAMGDGTPAGNEDLLTPDRRDRSCLWHLCPSLRKRCGKTRHLNCSFARYLLALPCKPFRRFNGRRMPNENLFVLSMIQILCGLASVILSGVAVTKLVFLYQMATGLWSGFLMLATGLHGILTSRRCNHRTLISLLVFCVLVALAACLLASVSVAGLIEDGLLRPETSFSVLSAPSISSASSAASYYDLLPPSRQDKSLAFEGRMKYPLPRDSETPIRFSLESQPSRLHQVVLHILLLVIGILEACVSVACAVLCCRQVCPSSVPPLSAINYLRNRGATLIPGGAEFLLAVAVEPDQPPPTLLDYKIPPPDFHPSVQPFLPRPGRRAFILTQAETGIHALAAAQTIAGLLSPSGRNQSELVGDACTCQQLLFAQDPSLPSRPFIRRALRRFRSRLRPRGFRHTSETSRRRAAAAQLMSQLISLLPTLDVNNINNGGGADGSSRYSTTLLYVLSSPSPSEPPMIFPPFPPAYCREETRLESPPAPDISRVLQPQSFNIDPFLCSTVLPHSPSTSHGHPVPPILRAPAVSLGRSQSRGGHANFPRSNPLPPPPTPIVVRSSTRRQLGSTAETAPGLSSFRSAWPFQRHSNPLLPAVTLFGDRILQPVLVIEDQQSNKDRPPPHYASTDRLQPLPPPLYPFQMADGR